MKMQEPRIKFCIMREMQIYSGAGLRIFIPFNLEQVKTVIFAHELSIKNHIF